MWGNPLPSPSQVLEPCQWDCYLLPRTFQQIWDKACPSEIGGHREFYFGFESWFILELAGPPWAEVLGPGWQALQLPGACGRGRWLPGTGFCCGRCGLDYLACGRGIAARVLLPSSCTPVGEQGEGLCVHTCLLVVSTAGARRPPPPGDLSPPEPGSPQTCPALASEACLMRPGGGGRLRQSGSSGSAEFSSWPTGLEPLGICVCV